MKKGLKILKILIAALTICTVVSAYATCYSLRSEYCQNPGTLENYHTYTPTEQCYPGTAPIYVSNDPLDIEAVSRCNLIYQGLPEYPYNRVWSSCHAWVYYDDCHGQRYWAYWSFGYQQCTDHCSG